MLRTSLLLQKLKRKITLKLLVLELRFLHSALSRMAVYQCIKFHLITFYTAKIKKGSNSVNTGDRVMVLAFCNSPDGPLSISSFI